MGSLAVSSLYSNIALSLSPLPDTGGHAYPRDVVLSTIEWDSPSCHDTQNRCTGTNWAPLLRVNFVASHTPTRLTNTPSGCNTGSNLRCDDPLDLSGSSGLAAPQVESTWVLNDLLVQVQTSGSWNTLKDYQFSYEQSGPSTITDPLTTKAEPTAGMLDLTQIREAGEPGSAALMYSGEDNSATLAYAYLKVFDLSSQHLGVSASTTLSYWIYPQSSATNSLVSGSNSTCVALDLIFTDGTSLHDSNAVDQHGHRVHPAFQCNLLVLDQWNLVTTNVGAVAAGKTISHIDVGYDQAGDTGGYRGYVDDISLTSSASSTPLFATSFESGDPQLPSNDTVDTSPGAGGSTNVGGICCGLTGPEAGGRNEQAHTTGTVLPPRSFTYTTQTEQYEDDAFTLTSNCGPSWNTGCLLWSQSYAGNSRYLASVTNGMGLSQTFSWAEARNNTHEVNDSGTNNLDPLYCDDLQHLDPQRQSHYPCNQADDQNWSHIVLIEEDESVVQVSQNGQGGQQASTTITSQTKYTYKLTSYTANPCSDCLQGMYWGNQNDADYLDYYNGKFMGFAQTTVSHPDGSVDVHQFFTTLGWGIYDPPNTAPNYIGCFSPNPCHADPWWDYRNALHGHEDVVLSYGTDGTTLLKKVDPSWAWTCPPSGVSGSGSTSYGNFDGNLVSELDHNNPVAACDIQESQEVTYIYDGSNASNVPHKTTTYQYDSYGRVTQTTTTSNDGGATGSPTTIVTKPLYIWNDAVSATSTSATGTYLINLVAFTDTEDASGNRSSCTYTSYDGQPYATGQQSALQMGHQTAQDRYTGCGTAANGFAPSGLSKTRWTYDQWGNQITSTDADANAGISGHTGCTPTGGSGSYTTCTTYDPIFHTLTISSANALNQLEQTGYTQTAAGGFGLWPTSTTDVNGQTTTYGYDGLGRMTSRTLPGETSGQPTTTWAYTFWCAPGGPQAPCMEVDETQRLNNATTITTRAFYDGLGRLVELRSPGPNGQDVVHFRFYDTAGRAWFESVQYFVAAYSGPPGADAYSLPDSMQVGTTTTFDGLGRVTSTKDAVSDLTTNKYSVVCGTISGDSACYEQGLVTDPLGHQRATLGDALGREIYDQRYTGNNASTYHVYATTTFTYDYNTNLTKITAPDGVTTTTFQFDMLGRQTGLVDPDRGTESYVYDPNGNRIQSTDARGSSGTVYVGYDGLNRQIWRSTNSNGSSPYVTYTYDSTANGNYGIGHVTSETFTNGTLSGSYSYVYDQRGQQITNTLTVGSTSYPAQTTYDDATNVLSQTYPDGEVVTNNYTAEGWLTGVNTQVGSTTVTLLSNASYTGAGGAGHLITGAALDGGMYQYATSYDALLRLTDTKYTLSSNGSTLYDEQRAFDAAGNVTNETTTLPQGTDAQAFCYDEQDRVTWAGSVGMPPCSGTTLSPGTLTSAQYSQSYSYDTLGRLTSGALGSYTYGASAHVHAATGIGGSYTTSYDAAGDETCRAPTSATTCAGGTPTGAQLGYDNEGRLTQWQNTPTSPTTTDSFLYDAEGNRVAQQAIQNGTTTTTVYVGNLEEVGTTGGSTTTTTYYYAGGQRIALAVNGLFSYLATDAETSVSVAFDANGNVQASQLFNPYGVVRYSNGTMPGSYGFTGQHADPVTGLDYYNARYYDPTAGQFTSADTMLPGKGYDPWGLSRYAYVEGNPISRTDPSGHGWFDSIAKAVTHAVKAVAPVAMAALDATTGIPSMINDVKTVFSGNASTLQKIMAVGDLALNVAMDASMVVGVGEGIRAAYVGAKVATEVTEHALVDAGEHAVAHTVEDTAEHGAEDAAEKTIDLYRGTDRASEIAVQEDSGQIMSDAAREQYMSSRADGASVESALDDARSASEAAHAQQLSAWGSLENYVQAHSAFGTELNDIGPRSMISWTTNPDVARTFGSTIFKTTVPLSVAIPQTLGGAGEAEYLIMHMVSATRIKMDPKVKTVKKES